ncbi:MAG: hypothetical protein Q7U97_04250, partial [Rhodocyclaceae bacterium]|nr:hypothetical protein [Rhodocyclaceae bacterium]
LIQPPHHLSSNPNPPHPSFYLADLSKGPSDWLFFLQIVCNRPFGEIIIGKTPDPDHRTLSFSSQYTTKTLY